MMLITDFIEAIIVMQNYSNLVKKVFYIAGKN